MRKKFSNSTVLFLVLCLILVITTACETAEEVSPSILPQENTQVLESTVTPEPPEPSDPTEVQQTPEVQDIPDVPATPGALQHQSTERTGNTPGNIVNGGYAAFYEGRIYHCGSRYEEGGAVYSENPDGSERVKVSDDPAGYINVIDDRIYYALFDYENDDFGIISINTDGSDRRKIVDDFVWDVTVVEDSVFYCTDDGIFSVNIDGSDTKELRGVEASGINIFNGYIYYYCWNYEGIFKMKTDGSDPVKINDDLAYCLIVVGGIIYYNSERGIHVIDIEGNYLYEVTSDRVNSIIVVEDLIFYVNAGDNYRLYTINTDGSDRKKLADFDMMDINEAGGRLYINLWPDWVELYTIKTDGTDGRYADE